MHIYFDSLSLSSLCPEHLVPRCIASPAHKMDSLLKAAVQCHVTLHSSMTICCLPASCWLGIAEAEGQQGLKPARGTYPPEQKPILCIFWSPARHQNRYVIAIEQYLIQFCRGSALRRDFVLCDILKHLRT